MQPDKALQNALEKITDLMNLVEDELKNPTTKEKKVSPEIEKMVSLVETQVEAFRLLYFKTMREAHIDEGEIKKKLTDLTKAYGVKDRRLLDRLENIKQEVQTRRQSLIPYVKKAKEKLLTKKQKKKVRKKKFRGLGSRGKWKKL